MRPKAYSIAILTTALLGTSQHAEAQQPSPSEWDLLPETAAAMKNCTRTSGAEPVVLFNEQAATERHCHGPAARTLFEAIGRQSKHDDTDTLIGVRRSLFPRDPKQNVYCVRVSYLYEKPADIFCTVVSSEQDIPPPPLPIPPAPAKSR